MKNGMEWVGVDDGVDVFYQHNHYHPHPPHHHSFAYSFFVGLMYNESPTTFVERNRMTPLLSHVERRYAQLEQATRTGVYASPTLVTALLRKLLTLVGSDAIHSARDSDDHMASFQRMYALTQDKSARLLITQVCVEMYTHECIRGGARVCDKHT